MSTERETEYPKGRCEFARLSDTQPQCEAAASRKWGDHWFCEEHGKRLEPECQPAPAPSLPAPAAGGTHSKSTHEAITRLATMLGESLEAGWHIDDLRVVEIIDKAREQVPMKHAALAQAAALRGALEPLCRQLEAQFSYHRDEIGQDVPSDEITYHLAPIFEPLIRAGKSALTGSAGDGWLPIETAPRDGTHILIGRLGHPWSVTASWSDGYKHWSTGLGAMAYYAEPTHWRPLPPPPAAEGGGL